MKHTIYVSEEEYHVSFDQPDNEGTSVGNGPATEKQSVGDIAEPPEINNDERGLEVEEPTAISNDWHHVENSENPHDVPHFRDVFISGDFVSTINFTGKTLMEDVHSELVDEERDSPSAPDGDNTFDLSMPHIDEIIAEDLAPIDSAESSVDATVTPASPLATTDPVTPASTRQPVHTVNSARGNTTVAVEAGIELDNLRQQVHQIMAADTVEAQDRVRLSQTLRAGVKLTPLFKPLEQGFVNTYHTSYLRT